MPRFNVSTQRFDPYRNFKFRVRLDGRTVAGFSAITESGPGAEMDVYRAGVESTTLRKLPGMTKFAAITLERGVTHAPDLDATAKAVAIETIQFENEGWKRDIDDTG
ncbi:MAG: phage tail protein [Gammaproteobacteria bacterium]|nr:phage tail protein [Gammaproteobacteria bacterium]